MGFFSPAIYRVFQSQGGNAVQDITARSVFSEKEKELLFLTWRLLWDIEVKPNSAYDFYRHQNQHLGQKMMVRGAAGLLFNC